MKENPKLGKVDPQFDHEIEEIIRDRYSKSLDKRPIGRAVVQRKIIKHPGWLAIKIDLKNWTFMPEGNMFKNKKGQAELMNPTFNLFTFIVIAFLATVMFAGLSYSMHLINNVMMDVGIQNDQVSNPSAPMYVNMTQAAIMTFGQANAAMSGIKLVSMALIFSMIMLTILVNFFYKVHPAFFALYVLFAVLAVIFSVPVSNAYETLLQSGTMEDFMQQQVFANYVLLHLPIWVTLIAGIGAITLFVNILRNSEEKGL